MENQPRLSPREIKELRESLHVKTIEISARTGLPSNFIQDIESEKIVALDSDLIRITRALREIARSRE